MSRLGSALFAVRSKFSPRRLLGSAAMLALVAAVAFGFMAGPSLVTAQSATTFAAGDALVVNTDALNLRAGASISDAVDAVLYTGDAVTVVSGPVSADGYNWYQVSTASGTGYVDGEYLAATLTYSAASSTSTGLTVGGGYVVNTDALNLRSDASISATVDAVLATGDSVTILAGPTTADGYDWYQVSTTAGTGYVDGEYLAATTTLSAATASGFSTGDNVLVSSDNVHLRADASLSATIDAVLYTGDAGTIVSGPVSADGYVWYEISTSLGTGWVDAEWLTLA
jgi:uncharacterized protein YgiM (DUF1202 family)